jgi:Stress responsive A/B Barrel Domain
LREAGSVIRNIVLVKLKAGQDPTAVANAQQAFLDLNCPGTLSYVIGDDLGLREGNWSFAIVADFTDAEAYRAYDQDPVHNQARAGLIPLTEQIARVQFEMP